MIFFGIVIGAVAGYFLSFVAAFMASQGPYGSEEDRDGYADLVPGCLGPAFAVVGAVLGGVVAAVLSATP